MNEELAKILAEGTREVIISEPVLDGLTRPLLVRYTSEDGVVEEVWDYVPNSAMTRWWGAINGITYTLVSTTKNT
jgi:hypothetical protein